MSKVDLTNLISEYGAILSSFVEHISDMVFLMAVEDHETFRFVMMNPSAMKAAGIGPEVYGKRIEDVYPAEKANLLISKYKDAVSTGQPISFVEENGLVAESILTPFINPQGVCTHVFSITRDITVRKKLEEQLHFLAYHDSLTGLPNRRLLYDRLDQAINNANRDRYQIAVLYLDFDDFKCINDSYGHDMGDYFLRAVSEGLKKCLRSVDTIARLGGDEFIIVLASLSDPLEAAKIAKRIVHSLSRPLNINGHELQITISVGISLFPGDGQTIEDLIAHADKAMYHSKTLGKNQFAFYSPSMS